MGKWKNQRAQEIAAERTEPDELHPHGYPINPEPKPMPMQDICGDLEYGRTSMAFPAPSDVKGQPLKRESGVDEVKAMDIARAPGVHVVKFKDGTVSLEFTGIPNEQARRIVEEILPPALELYLNKSRDYGGNVMEQVKLGVKACIPDMQRKFGKLINAVWFDKPLKFEKPEEIGQDLLGHLLIFLDELKTGSSR